MIRRTASVLLGCLVLAGCHLSRGGRAAAGGLAVAHAVIPASPSPSEASAFMVIENGSGETVTFTGVLTPSADSVLLHRLVGGVMQPAPPLEIAAHGYLNLVPGGDHLMLEGLRRPLTVGDTVRLALRFGSGVTLSVRVPVLNYTDAVSELPIR